MSSQSLTESQQNYTILRIKRKRNEEPLDALVIESAKRKKSRGSGEGLNVFQFAETVEESAWDDERQKQDLETRISSLARAKVRAGVQPTPPLKSVTKPPNDAVVETTTTRVSSPAATPTDTNLMSSSSQKKPRVEDPLRKYTIVPTQSAALRPAESAEWETRKRARLTEPPKVHSYKELQKATFTMYDAIPSATSLASLASTSPGAQTKAEADEMAKFLPLLQDYLNISDASSLLAPPPSRNSAVEDGDYVWDVFYSRPATYNELYGDAAKAIGSVTGLPDDDAQGSSDESDYGDEEDEDSNAEDWYKNDYPDEEDDRSFDDDLSDGSDAFHEDSGSDEDVAQERGRWHLAD